MGLNASEDPSLAQVGQFRIFVQEDGPSPASPYLYHGKLSMGGITQALGDDTPIFIPSSVQANKWDIAGAIPGSPALPTTDFTTHMLKLLTDVWWDFKRTNCRFNAQVKIDSCGRPDDWNSWEAKMLLARAKLTTLTGPLINPLTGDENAVAQLTGSLTMLRWEVLKQIRFEEQADATILAEVLDGFYYDFITCGDCGQPSDGCRKEYNLTLANSGSPGLSSQIVFTLDDKATWNTIDIPTLGGLSGRRFVPVGNRAVVISPAVASHHHIQFSQLDAGNALAWQEVTTGYTNAPRAIYSKSSSETFIGAVGGVVYLMTNPTAGVIVLTDGSVTTQNVNDIRGCNETVVAVCDSNAILKSDNDGVTFELVIGPEVGINLNTIEVLSELIWWVGTGNGNLYYTIDGGETWVENTPDADLSVINMVRFFDENVGYFSAEVGAIARVYRTDDLGNTWHNDEPWITGLPTADRYNFVAPCGYNEVATGGRVSAGGDGILAIAE